MKLFTIGDSISHGFMSAGADKPQLSYSTLLARAYPPLDTKYYDVRPDGTIQGGGIFSLDGIHPTASAHGIIAREFMKVMQAAGAMNKSAKLDWRAILASDLLRTQPIRLMQELYQHDHLLRAVLTAIQLLR